MRWTPNTHQLVLSFSLWGLSVNKKGHGNIKRSHVVVTKFSPFFPPSLPNVPSLKKAQGTISLNNRDLRTQEGREEASAKSDKVNGDFYQGRSLLWAKTSQESRSKGPEVERRKALGRKKANETGVERKREKSISRCSWGRRQEWGHAHGILLQDVCAGMSRANWTSNVGLKQDELIVALS